MEQVDLQLFINGEWALSVSGGTFEVVNPTNGWPVGRAAKGERTDA